MKKRILIIGGYHKAQRLARSFLDKATTSPRSTKILPIARF